MVQVILSTFPDQETARRIAAVLVEERLAACVNLLAEAESVYRWQGKVETAREIPAVMKTTPDRAAALCARLRELHPYEVPEIVLLAPGEALPAYAAWIKESVAPA